MPVNGSVPLTGTGDALAGVWVVATGVGIIGLNGSELNGRVVGVPIRFVVVPLEMLEEVEVVVPPEDIMPFEVIPVVEPDVVVVLVPVPMDGIGLGLKVNVKPTPVRACLTFRPFAAVGATTELSPFGMMVARMAWLLGLAFWPRSPARRTKIDRSLHSCAARFGRIDRSDGRSPCARRCRRTDARRTAPRPSLMKLFELLSQD
jgi:hypothetical protein